jgi:hypothetical protein
MLSAPRRTNQGLASWVERVLFRPNGQSPENCQYALDALLVLVPLVVVIYFLAYPDKFNAFLNWMVGRR